MELGTSFLSHHDLHLLLTNVAMNCWVLSIAVHDITWCMFDVCTGLRHDFRTKISPQYYWTPMTHSHICICIYIYTYIQISNVIKYNQIHICCNQLFPSPPYPHKELHKLARNILLAASGEDSSGFVRVSNWNRWTEIYHLSKGEVHKYISR